MILVSPKSRPPCPSLVLKPRLLLTLPVCCIRFSIFRCSFQAAAPCWVVRMSCLHSRWGPTTSPIVLSLQSKRLWSVRFSETLHQSRSWLWIQSSPGFLVFSHLSSSCQTVGLGFSSTTLGHPLTLSMLFSDGEGELVSLSGVPLAKETTWRTWTSASTW